RSGHWWSCRCPTHDDRTPSLSVRDGERGLIVRCWAGCEPRDVLTALRWRGLIGGSSETLLSAATPSSGDVDRDDSVRRIEVARRIWSAAQDARGTPVELYLAGRGIVLSPPASLRWVPSLRRLDGTSGPAMVARIDSSDGELVGIARTWLACY